MSASHEWILGSEEEEEEQRSPQRSPESAVSLAEWEGVLADMTGISVAKIRICKVRLINAMRTVRPEE